MNDGVQPAAELIQRMNQTGIGYAGIDGVWWRPATAPVVLPTYVEDDLRRIGRALFMLFDMVLALYDEPSESGRALQRLLTQNVPATMRSGSARGKVYALRPDFQLCRRHDGRGYQLCATELEICPSAQGFAYAMQVGYNLQPTLADQMAAWLAGRHLLWLGSAQWSEFLFEQLAFCRALAERGAQSSVLYDLPLAQIAAEAGCGRRWQPPIFGVERRPATWDGDVLARIRRHDLAAYWQPQDAGWPAQIGDAVVFRFGYVDQFTAGQLAHMRRWQAAGATFMNPPTFLLDSKVLMAAVSLESVRARIAGVDPAALATLDACIPKTILLTRSEFARLGREKDDWVIKFAGFDRANQAWGGRSLCIGAEYPADVWQAQLEHSVDLAWPVVAQRVAYSTPLDLDYFDEAGRVVSLRQGKSRLRAFFLRAPDASVDAVVGGVHVTLVAQGNKVAESTNAVQAPVIFQN